MKALGLVITLIMTLSSSAWGQSGKPRTLNELAAYTGPDRQKIILDGAKAEGKVLWYTSLSGNYRELVDAFKKKYPEVQIEVYRAGSSDVSQRLLSEAKAGRYLADALETTPGALMLLREAGVLKAYTSPELAKFPEEAKTRADKGLIYWVSLPRHRRRSGREDPLGHQPHGQRCFRLCASRLKATRTRCAA
jgi:ABC-type glycerol-3-phosphate transport system substrate-binding protein